MTSRGPLTLAALASAAVPGLDPDTVQGVVTTGPADTVEVAFIQDREHRRWVIRCPRTPAASAQLERSAALLAVLARRLTMPVPAVKGWAALPEGGRAAVHSYLTGRMVSLNGIAPGSDLARGLGRALAHLHNLDTRMYEEAGVPVYDAAGYRSRRLAELDRAAATGRVPTGLLGRWERVLDDETLWGFSATPTHGDLGDGTILATPDDGTDPDIKAFLGWESAQVADPADDIAPLLARMDAEAFDTVMEAYAHTRVERPDRHLHRRAEVIGEMQLVRTMMSLVAAGDDDGAEESAAQLRRLDERIARDEDEATRTHGPAATTSPGTATSGATVTGAASTTPGAGTGTSDTQPVATREGSDADAGTTTGTTASADAASTGSTGTTTEELNLPRSTRRDAQSPDPSPPGDAPVGTGDPTSGRTDESATTNGMTDESAQTQVAPETSADTRTSDEDDAVQVEHPAKVVPVAPVADDNAHTSGAHTSGATASSADASGSTVDPTGSHPENAPTGPAGASPTDTTEPDTNPTLRAVSDPEPTGPSTPTTGPGRGTDHETAEIVPIDDEGDDDVVPPHPRP